MTSQFPKFIFIIAEDAAGEPGGHPVAVTGAAGGPGAAGRLLPSPPPAGQTQADQNSAGHLQRFRVILQNPGRVRLCPKRDLDDDVWLSTNANFPRNWS